jgi:hypothetical protein
VGCGRQLVGSGKLLHLDPQESRRKAAECKRVSSAQRRTEGRLEMINVDPVELQKFSELAHRWWDPQSEFKPLHQINPLRARIRGSYCRTQRASVCWTLVVAAGYFPRPWRVPAPT